MRAAITGYAAVFISVSARMNVHAVIIKLPIATTGFIQPVKSKYFVISKLKKVLSYVFSKTYVYKRVNCCTTTSGELKVSVREITAVMAMIMKQFLRCLNFQRITVKTLT